MIDIKYAIRYLAFNYPYKNELSKSRLTKMIYLADWFSAQKNRAQLTDIEWYFDHYGPYVNDVYNAAKKDKKLIIKKDYSAYGSPKEIISVKDFMDEQELNLDRINDRDIKILDKVIDNTKHLNWSEFIDYVYDTYPIMSQRRYNFLKLVDLAEQKKNINDQK
jgi:uncharacterized phage-associated protein